jgi:hypothetical protein
MRKNYTRVIADEKGFDFREFLDEYGFDFEMYPSRKYATYTDYDILATEGEIEMIDNFIDEDLYANYDI